MQLLETVADLRKWNRENDSARPRVLVPTMGALHEGHLSLCEIARERAGEDGKVVATIFVNPTQFGPNEDLDAYPRELESDLEKCRSRGVDAVFAPRDNTEVYAPDASISVSENSLSTFLCGKSRPVHFGGVCTVVAKLFNLAEPDAAVFGEKDFQQLAIIRRLVRDLNFEIEIIGGETVRESDGLAMSSRNQYLSEAERAQAPVIRRALLKAAEAIEQDSKLACQRSEDSREAAPQDCPSNKEGMFDEPTLLIREIRKMIEGEASLAKVDYLEIVDAETMQPLETFEPGTELRIAAAVYFGKTRLIDNIGATT